MQSNDERTSLSVAAAVLSLSTSLALALLSYVEHKKSACPSFVIGLYLCIDVLLKSATARTYWFLYSNKGIGSITICAAVSQLVMLVLESWNKVKLLANGGQDIAAEEAAGFLSFSLFTWLDTLFFAGYRKALTPSDLGPIDCSLRASQLSPKFRCVQVNPKCTCGQPLHSR
jgi:ATP-binding cassette subfamily C (CFTR/MRP) protein 1